MISGGSAGGDVNLEGFFNWYLYNGNQEFFKWCWDNCTVSQSSLSAMTSIIVALMLSFPLGGGTGGTGNTQGVDYTFLIDVVRALLGVGYDGYDGATSLQKIDKLKCPTLYNLTQLNMIIGMLSPMPGLVLIPFPQFIAFYIGLIFILQILLIDAIVLYAEKC